MRPIDHTDPRFVTVHNAAASEPGPDGPVYLRYPADHIASFGGMAPIARFQTGIELQIGGAVARVRITLRVVESDHYGICAEFFRGPHKLLPTWQLDSRSREPQSITVEAVSELAGPMFALPFRFVFPTHTIVEILEIAVDAAADIQPLPEPWTYNALTTARPLHWVAYGDSITHGANTTCPTGTWVDMLGKSLDIAPANLANGGHGKAELAMARHIASRDQVDLVTLHMGVNCCGTDTPATYTERLGQFLAIIRERFPVVPILLTSPIWSCRDGAFPGKSPQDMRDATAAVCSARQAAGDTQITLVDGLSLGFTPKHLNADLLHLSEYGATHYYTQLLPHLAPIVAELRA